MTPEMTPQTPPPGRNSGKSSTFFRRAVLTFAAIGVLAAVAGSTVILKSVGAIKWDIFDLLTDSDEAPIRVRNGSLDLSIQGSQEWEEVGSSGTWRIANATRYREEFEVTIAVRAGATCGGSLTATGSDIVLIYERTDAAASTVKIVLQSAGRRTMVRPDTGVTLTSDAATPDILRYTAAPGFLKSIAVGNGANPAVICSFTSASQLDHMLILNVP